MKRSQTSLLALAAVSALGFPSLGCKQGKEPAPIGTAAPVAAAQPAPAPASAKESFGSFTVAELEAKMQAAKAGQLKLFIYDNNSQERYAKSHVPGAKWVYYETVTEKDLPQDKDATLVFYCANEHWHACHVGAVSAVKLGYKNVYILPSGIMGWEKAGKPVETGT